jgi:hypothetical protein
VTTAGGLSTAGARTTADPQTAAVLVDALIDVVDLHRIILCSKSSESTGWALTTAFISWNGQAPAPP